MIDWIDFLIVFVAAFLSTVVVVSAYSLGIRLLTVSGRTPIVTPAEVRKAEKRAAKAAKKSPLSDAQKRTALVGAWACFAVSACAVLFGIYLIVGEHVLKLLGLA